MTAKIIVGFSLSVKPDIDVETLMPVFTFPSNWKPETKEDNRLKKEQEFREGCGRQLYTSEFETVHLLDPSLGSEVHFQRGEWADIALFAAQRKKKAEPLSVALQVRQVLLNGRGSAWTDNIFDKRDEGPEAVFVGFRIKTFLKVLGVECALHGNPLPLSMWYGSSDHRDVENALVPDDASAKNIDLAMALEFFENAGVFYDDKSEKPFLEVPDNFVPGSDAKLDATISLLLGSRLGLITNRNASALLELREVAKPKTKKKRKAPEAVAAQ